MAKVFGFIMLFVCVSGCIFLITVSSYPPTGTPLGWDMSGHTIRATLMAQEISEFSLNGILHELRFWSVYPPVYYFVSGIWQSCQTNLKGYR